MSEKQIGTPVLELDRVSRSYRRIPAICEVSFRVGAGEVVGYLGANGSGKSTTVKIITGLLQPDDGKVLFRGRDIRENMTGFRASFGYVPEEAHVYTYLSGMEYLQLTGRLRGMRDEQIAARANQLLSLLGLADWRYSPIGLYSKGMKQRVLIAAALLHDPGLLIFDEPLSGLDATTARLFRNLLRELGGQGKAVLYISHVLEVVEQVCDRVVVITKGRVVADASPAEVRLLTGDEEFEDAFARLVEGEDTVEVARQVVAAVRG